MSTIAILRNDEETGHANLIAKAKDMPVYGIFESAPSENIAKTCNWFLSQCSETLANTAFVLNPKIGEQNYSLTNLPEVLLNELQITFIAKSHGDQSIVAVHSIDPTGFTNKQHVPIDSKWSQKTVSINFPHVAEGKDVRFKIKNESVVGAAITGIKVSAKLRLDKQCVSSLIAKFDAKHIVTNNATVRNVSPIPTTFLAIGQLTVSQPASIPIVSILTPTYNKISALKTCATNLLKSTPEIYEWIVLDDSSSDGTAEFVRNLAIKHRNVQLIEPQTRIANFSRANNEMAKKAKGKYLLLLNNDCYVTEGWLEPLVEMLDKDPFIGAVGNLLLFPGTNKIQHCGVVFYPLGHLGVVPVHMHHERIISRHSSYINQTRSYHAVTAACCLIRKELFDNLGGFDEDYVFGYEDVDLCLRMKEFGYKIVYEPKSKAYHDQGATLDSSAFQETKSHWLDNNRQLLKAKWSHVLIPDHASYEEDASFNAYAPPAVRPRIAYFPITRGQGHDIYRTDHAVKALSDHGNSVSVFNWKELDSFPSDIDIAMIQRIFSTPESELFVDEIRKRYPRARIGYDIDDLIFDITVANSSHLHSAIVATCDEYGHFMRHADFFTTTTNFLAATIQKRFKKPTFVIPNVAIPEFLQRPMRRSYSKEIVIGYAPGSATHDRDFSEIVGVLKKVLAKYPNVILKLIGHLSVPEDLFRQFPRQVRISGFVPFQLFPNELSVFDINLAPLARTVFNEAKSALKYVEAGALGIPTIASSTSGYTDVINHGSTGILCSSEDEWFSWLSRLVEDGVLRRAIGDAARADIEQNYTIKKAGEYLLKIFSSAVRS